MITETEAVRTCTREEWEAAVAEARVMDELSRSVRIVVTESDIRNGQCGEPGACAIALAATRVLGVPVEVSLWHIQRATHPYDTVGLLPEEAEEFVVRFDRGGRVEPFAFTLIPVDQ